MSTTHLNNYKLLLNCTSAYWDNNNNNNIQQFLEQNIIFRLMLSIIIISPTNRLIDGLFSKVSAEN